MVFDFNKEKRARALDEIIVTLTKTMESLGEKCKEIPALCKKLRTALAEAIRNRKDIDL